MTINKLYFYFIDEGILYCNTKEISIELVLYYNIMWYYNVIKKVWNNQVCKQQEIVKW